MSADTPDDDDDARVLREALGGSWGDRLTRILADRAALRARLEAAERENAGLRKMLAVRVAGATLYADDGELQDNRVQPFIDFKRDSLADIESKLIDRMYAAMKEPPR